MKKRADELKPGDVLAPSGHVVLEVRRVAGGVGVVTAGPGGGWRVMPMAVWTPGDESDVEAPELTPVQEHADDLAATLRALTTVKVLAVEPEMWQYSCDLLAKIGPSAQHGADELRRFQKLGRHPCVIAPVHYPELTPAQRLADELVAMVRRTAAALDGTADALSAAERDVLDKIDPPRPPTAQELAAALAKVCENGAFGSGLGDAEALVKRAKRAGLL